VLGVTSVLVQVTPARNASADSGTGGGAAVTIQSATLRDRLYVLTVDVQPATVGVNDIHLYASTPDGQPSTIKEWQVRASLPDQGIEPIDASILAVTSYHAIGTIGLPSPGRWKFTFTLRTTEIDQSTVTTEFTVQ
jgi:copper transport protein